MPGTDNLVENLLRRCAESDASDLHLDAGQPPRMRINTVLQIIDEVPVSEEDISNGLKSLSGKDALKQLNKHGSYDCAVSLSPGNQTDESLRFRMNAFRSQYGLSLAARWLKVSSPRLSDLNLPEEVSRCAGFESGLVLFSGPTGAGKSTSLAALLLQIAADSPSQILTVEDPIEYLLPSQKALIRQREVNRHSHSFASALRDSMRQDPDVILVGELRDAETARAALSAAETGHLVFSTLHSARASGAIDRLVGMFPIGERDVIRYQLAQVLQGVVAQRLLLTREKDAMVPAVEILWANQAVSNLIASGKTAQLDGLMENGTQMGMCTMEHSLADLVLKGRVAVQAACRLVRHTALFNGLISMNRDTMKC